MADLKHTVALTNVNMENLSRGSLLEWVNNTVNGNYTKIEELCSGIAYCQMMEQLFPNCVGLKKVKTTAKLEHEHLHNLRLLQTAFTRLKFDKSVPIDRLLKGRFQDNFEFLQWFKKFYDSICTSNGKENIPDPISKTKRVAKQLSNPMLNGKEHNVPKKQSVPEKQAQRGISELQDDMEVFKSKLEDVKVERDFCFKKLTAIESLLNNTTERGEHEDFCKRVMEVLYAVEDDSTEDFK